MSHGADSGGTRGAGGRARWRAGREWALGFVIVAGLCSAAALVRWVETHRPPELQQREIEELYVSPEAARRASLCFNGLVADWYWMRSLQYVGRRALAHRGKVNIEDLSPLGLKVLAPLLDVTTTLDPQFGAAYEFGAAILPAFDSDAAVRLAEKGIRANPQAWRLYQHLGYVRWQRGEYREASAAYDEGSRQPGAPRWMKELAARIEAEGGDRSVAREVFRRMHAETDDEQVKRLALRRLAQIQSFEERDRIRPVLEAYREQNGRCPAGWREVAPALRRAGGLALDATGAPLDPSGAPYVLAGGGCEVDLDPTRSDVPYR
jgi:tetratricopeptide (TPR) repeat protein